MVAQLVSRGVINWQEALKHPRRNQLMMSISARREVVEPVLVQVEMQPGDQLLLCSDGLWAVVPEEQILYYATNFSPQTAVDDLVQQACDYGGPDNISIILARASNK